MNKLLDLRFVIGVFFTLIGLLLLIYSFIAGDAEADQSINRYCGLAFLIFGIFMIIISFGKEAYDELLEEPPRE